MYLHHEDVLADIECRVRDDGATLDEIDAAIAVELGVAAEHYYAYLLVWGAIESYRQQGAMTVSCSSGVQTVLAEGLAHCRSLVEAIGWHGATIYQQAADLGPLATDIADHAAKTLGAVLALRQELRDLHAASSGAPEGDGGQAVRS